jgi:hypothetical protein
VPSQPGPHGSGAGDHEEISGMNKQEQLLAATPQAQAHSFGAGDLFEHDGIPKVNEQEQLLQQSGKVNPTNVDLSLLIIEQSTTRQELTEVPKRNLKLLGKTNL